MGLLTGYYLDIPMSYHDIFPNAKTSQELKIFCMTIVVVLHLLEFARGACDACQILICSMNSIAASFGNTFGNNFMILLSSFNKLTKKKFLIAISIWCSINADKINSINPGKID